MKRMIVLLVLLVALNSNAAWAGNDSDDRVYSDFCSLVSEAMSLYADAPTRHEFIKDHLDKKAVSKDTKDAYDAIYQIAPEKRYETLKKAIEKQTDTKWDCLVLKEHFEQYVKKQ